MIISRCTCGGVGLLKEMGSGSVAVECQKCGLIGPICGTESTAATEWGTVIAAARAFPNPGTASSIYKKAVEKYGADYQRHRLVEECAEFIVAHEHLKRGRISEDDMIEELVDIEILLRQMKEIYSDVRWEEIYARKIARLARTIKE